MTTDQAIDNKAPANPQSIQNRKSSMQSESCPDPECQLEFFDFGALYEHYIKSHPHFILRHGHTKPFKCPFCPKRYKHDRYVFGHIKRHKRKSSSIGSAEEQQTLIQESHDNMAHRMSQSHAKAHGRTSSDDEGENSAPKEGYSLLSDDGVVYIDEGVEPESSTSEQSSQANMQESRGLPKATPIGLILQAHPSEPYNSHPRNQTSSVKVALGSQTLEPNLSDQTDIDDDDDYPEPFALDESELPTRTLSPSSGNLSLHLSTEIFHQTLSHSILFVLGMHHYISTSEIADLFTHFLDSSDRHYMYHDLSATPLDQDDSTVVASLHDTDLKDLLDAWVEFKILGIRFAPNRVLHATKDPEAKNRIAKSITMALLSYMQSLEDTIQRANDTPHVLHSAPLSPLPTMFPQLVAALASRVKYRVVHDASSANATKILLNTTRDHIRILQKAFRKIYPIDEGYKEAWRALRLL